MSFVERIKLTDGTEVASVNASNQLEVAEANSAAIKTAVELIDNAISGSEMQVDIVASLPAGTNNIGDVDVLTVPAPLSTTGGGTEATALRVTLANDSTGLISIDDNGGSITVDGTVASTQSGTWNVNNISGTVSLPTGASTSANQSTIITALQLLDDVVATDGSAALTKLYQVGGTDGTNAQILSTNASGHLNIADGGNSITVDGTVGVSGTVTVADGGGSITVDGTVAATQSGTWNVTNISGTVSLPTGASTSANQSTMITALQLLDNAVATDGSTAVTGLFQVGGTDGTNAQILSTNASGHLNIADGGNSITVDGTFWQATQPVSIASSVAVTDNSGSLTVDAPVGTPVFVRLSDGASPITALPVTDNGASLTVDGTVAATQSGTWNIGSITTLPSIPAGTNNIGDVDVLTVPAPLSTAGGGTEATALRVTIANDSTGVLSIDDNGSSITVDGTVAATQSGTWNITNVSGTVSLPTGASTAANQSTIITAVQLLDDVVVTDNAGFTDGTTKLSMNGFIFDEVAGTALTENDAAAARIDAKRSQVHTLEDGVTRGRYATVTAANALKVDGSAVTQPVSGTVSITANSAVNLAQVGGTNTVTGGTAGTQAIGGIQAHDAAVSGNNPVLIGAFANNTTGPASVADGDLSRLWCNSQGAMVIAAQYSEEIGLFLTDGVGTLQIDSSSRLLTNTVLSAGTAYFGKVRLTDGTTDAEVVPLTGYNAQAVAIVDGSGNQITSFGGGTQYTEGDIDTTITGTAMMFETNTGTSTLGVVSSGNPLPISDNGSSLTVDGTVSITANSSVNLSQVGGTTVVTGGTNGTLAIGGIQAHDAALSGNNPLLIGSYYALTPTDVVSGDVTRTWASPKGALLVGGKYEATPPNWALSGDAVYHLTLASDGRLRVDVDFTGKSITTVGNVAHDSVDSGNPNKIGAKAIAHGTNPAAVADADRTNLYANRHGILWTIGGHPNLQSAEYITTAAQTNDNIMPLISAGTKYVITGITVAASAANTVNTSVRIGFGTSGVPAQGASGADAVTKVILSHPNIAPGSGISKGHAGGIVGIGGDGEDLYITCSVPTSGSLIVQIDYYTIES